MENEAVASALPSEKKDLRESWTVQARMKRTLEISYRRVETSRGATQV